SAHAPSGVPRSPSPTVRHPHFPTAPGASPPVPPMPPPPAPCEPEEPPVPASGTTQLPSTQTSGAKQVTFTHVMSTHWPVFGLQVWTPGQVTPLQRGTQPSGSTHFSPSGHFTLPLQKLTHIPLVGSQFWPFGQVTPWQPLDTHWFDAPVSQTVPEFGQPMLPAKQLHGKTQTPPSQLWPAGHWRWAHGSTQAPPWQTSVPGQTTPLQASTHFLSTQIWPGAHPQSTGTQRWPFAVLVHEAPAGQSAPSPLVHVLSHTLWKQTVSVGHGVPIVPSQLLSTVASQASGAPGWTLGSLSLQSQLGAMGAPVQLQ